MDILKLAEITERHNDDETTREDISDLLEAVRKMRMVIADLADDLEIEVNDRYARSGGTPTVLLKRSKTRDLAAVTESLSLIGEKSRAQFAEEWINKLSLKPTHEES